MKKTIFTLSIYLLISVVLSITSFAEDMNIPTPKPEELTKCSVRYDADYTINKKDYATIIDILEGTDTYEVTFTPTNSDTLSVLLETKSGRYYYSFGNIGDKNIMDITTDGTQALNYQTEYASKIKNTLISLINNYTPDISFDKGTE